MDWHKILVQTYWLGYRTQLHHFENDRTVIRSYVSETQHRSVMQKKHLCFDKDISNIK